MTNMRYNYKHFEPQDWDENPFATGVDCHDKFPIRSVVFDWLGNKIPLKSFLGQRFVLETGSLTCPHYIKNISSMNTLNQKYRDIPFFVIYVREEHPGEILSPHQSREEKHDRSFFLESHEGEQRAIYADTVDGNLHKKIGTYPNIIYVIDENGDVEFKRFWNNPEALNTHLSSLQTYSQTSEPKDSLKAFPLKPASFMLTFRTLIKAGPRAVIDLISSRYQIWRRRNNTTFTPR